MRDLVKQKFERMELAEKLWKTKGQDLKEGNYWHDNYWGSCTCDRCGDMGKNMLGKMLMEIRDA